MSEDEKIIDNFKYWFETNTENGVSTIPDFICKKLLDLCQKEREKNKELEDENTKLSEEIIENICKGAEEDVMEEYRQQLKNSISKDKIKELKDFYIQEHKDKNIDLIPIKNIIDNLKILQEE